MFEYEPIEVKKTDPSVRLLAEAFANFFCYLFYLYLILLAIRIPEFVLSIIGIFSRIKIIYLLSILSFFLFILYFFLICFISKKATLIGWLLIILIICTYLIDGTCYFLYFYEEINTISIFILLIISDLSIIPALIISIIFKMMRNELNNQR